MPQTENTPTIAPRTCVTCGKTFYVDLYDEKMRAAKGFAPRSECNECMQARMRLIEEQNRCRKENNESKIVSEGVRIYKQKLLAEAVVTTLAFILFSVAIIVNMLQHKISIIGFFIIVILITTILFEWIRYFSI